MKTNLTETQKDYAVFLPSISGFYGTFVGKQRYEDYVDPSRVPAGLGNVESLNFLNPKDGAFHYKWALYSAGHADLDTTKFVDKEDMVRNRDRDNSWLLGDSGGFQIAKGLWPGDWTSETCPHANKKRELVVNWMEEYMDYGMMLDIPTWTFQSAKASKATNIKSYDDAVKATHINARYYMKHRRGNFKVLNVLQGSNHTNADSWYEEFKGYCDPKQYPDTHFNGWAMGGQNMCDVHLILRRLVHMIHDGLLEQGLHDVMHFLGTSKLEWAVLLTDIQRAVRKYHNPNFMITYDCASPFLATANGQIYHNIRLDHKGKWSYIMSPGADALKYASDTRSFIDAVLQDGLLPTFEESPVSQHCKMNDICIYAPGDKNKVGTIKVEKGKPELDKQGNPLLDDNGNPIIMRKDSTSWDSFSYALQMGHNVWMHIESTQRANERYDAGEYPYMMVYEPSIRHVFRDIVNEIFAQKDREKSLAVINKYGDDKSLSIWTHIIGTRLKVGKKTITPEAKADELFDWG
jgi:hypothetical protein